MTVGAWGSGTGGAVVWRRRPGADPCTGRRVRPPASGGPSAGSAGVWRAARLGAALALSCLVAPGPSQAQTARLPTEADSVTAGRPFRVTVTVRHAPGEQTSFPRVPLGDPSARPAVPLGDAEVLSVRRLPPELSARARTDRAVLEAVTFAADSARLGPLTVAVVAGGDTVAVRTNAVTVPVRSVLVGEAEPYAPAPLGPPPAFASVVPLWIALGLAAGLALAAIGWAVVRAVRRPARTPPASPYAEAAAALDRLDARPPPEGAPPDAIEAHVVAARDVLRTYLARRLGLPVRRTTTAELDGVLASDARVSGPAAAAVRQALRPTDLVAFARVRPAPAVVARLRAETRAAVEAVEGGLQAQARDAADGTGPAHDAAVVSGPEPPPPSR